MLERLISDLAHIYTRLRIEWRRSELALGKRPFVGSVYYTRILLGS